jgi:hypothetical protein
MGKGQNLHILQNTPRPSPEKVVVCKPIYKYIRNKDKAIKPRVDSQDS